MNLLFEKSQPGRGSSLIGPCDVEMYSPGEEYSRKTPLLLPELSESDISRHYSALERRAHGVNNGFYPLGSCTMKYNPAVNEKIAGMSGFCDVHPLQPDHTAQGCLEVLALAGDYLCEITGMDNISLQPAAGAHGEFTGIALIKQYHRSRGDLKRDKLIIPDSSHGTNPATSAMTGMRIVNIPTKPDGRVDTDMLKQAAGGDTAGLMLTNPNTLGLFEKDILKITEIIHDAGGLVYCDGANMNAIMGVARPGDMGFDCIHLNLHKTFATPHGGGGPGAGALGCKSHLSQFLPSPVIAKTGSGYSRQSPGSQSIGRVKGFDGNFLVVLKALAYILTLGGEGIVQTAHNAVLNANYLMKLLSECYTVAYPGQCMHEFVLSMEKEADEKGITASDIAKALIDHGIHPPTVYFPLIVREALMVEPTETEGKETLDMAAGAFLSIYRAAIENPQAVKTAPVSTPVGRPDEVTAARNPVIKYTPGV